MTERYTAKIKAGMMCEIKRGEAVERVEMVYIGPHSVTYLGPSGLKQMDREVFESKLVRIGSAVSVPVLPQCDILWIESEDTGA